MSAISSVSSDPSSFTKRVFIKVNGTRPSVPDTPDYRYRMRRFAFLSRTQTFPVVAIFVYFLIRSTASVGHVAGHFPDSLSYETLTFVGKGDRFWSVPLFYSWFTTEESRVFVQVLVGTCAWGALALTLARRSAFSRSVIAITLFLGLAPQVIRYDLAILSESLGISFAVMAVATTLWICDSPGTLARVCLCASVTLCVFTRPTHLVVVTALLCGAIVSIAMSKGRRHIPTVIALSFLLSWGLVQLNGNKPYSTLNFYTVLMDRIIPSDARYQWFVSEGMPDVPGVRESSGYDFQGSLDPHLLNIVKLPEGQQPPSVIRAGGTSLATWVVDHGWKTYGKFIVTHPSDTWERFTELSSPTLAAANDDFLPLENGAMQTRSFFMPWKLWAPVGLIALAFTAIRPLHRKRTLALCGMALITAVLYAATVLTAGIEHQRHAVTVAVLLRVLALAAVVYAFPSKTTSSVKQGELGSLSSARDQ